MKILVIGKTGQLGAELMKQAAEFDLQAVGTSHVECDVTDEEQVKIVLEREQPAVVINTSAYNLVNEAEQHPAAAFALNAIAPFGLAKACQERGIRLVTVSTDYVFDGQKGQPYVETDQPNPLQVYGISKLAGELAVRNANPDALVIRTAAVYGGATGSREKKGNFVLYILKEMAEKTDLEVSSEQITSPTFAGHLAAAIYQLLQRSAAGGVYHLAGAGQCSWAEFAQEIVRVKGGELKIIPVDRGGKSNSISMQRPLLSALANTKAKTLGVEMPAWQQGVQAYLQSLES